MTTLREEQPQTSPMTMFWGGIAIAAFVTGFTFLGVVSCLAAVLAQWDLESDGGDDEQ